MKVGILYVKGGAFGVVLHLVSDYVRSRPVRKSSLDIVSSHEVQQRQPPSRQRLAERHLEPLPGELHLISILHLLMKAALREGSVSKQPISNR